MLKNIFLEIIMLFIEKKHHKRAGHPTRPPHLFLLASAYEEYEFMKYPLLLFYPD